MALLAWGVVCLLLGSALLRLCVESALLVVDFDSLFLDGRLILF